MKHESHYITTIIQGGQKVCVHLMLTISTQGVLRLFDHTVHDICVGILESRVGWSNVKQFTHSFIHPQPDWLQFRLPFPHDTAIITVRSKNRFYYARHFYGLWINFRTEIYKYQFSKRTVLTTHFIAVLFTLDAGLLARSQYSEGPATGHLDTGFSRFPCAYKQTLRRFPTFQVATTCFLCSPPDLNSVVIDFMFCLHVK